MFFRTLSRRLAMSLAAVVAALAVLLTLPGVASALGSITLASSSVEEKNGRWKLKMKMNVGTAPDLAHVPMLFVFTPTVLYEMSLEDKTGEKPVLTKKQLVNQQPIVESMDVDFEGGGKIYPGTNFDFELRRDRGYEAGEYSLTVKRESDGAAIGGKMNITLNGQNEIIDRRSMVFAGEKKKEKKPAAAPEEKKEAPKAEAPSEPEAAPSAPSEPTSAPEPPPVPPKQGGCGCEAAGRHDDGGLCEGIAFVLAAVVGARRRKQASAA